MKRGKKARRQHRAMIRREWNKARARVGEKIRERINELLKDPVALAEIDAENIMEKIK